MVRDIDKAAVFLIVKKVMDEHDLESLLRLGSPSDEYDPETKKVVYAIHREGPVNVEELARITRFVLHYSYHSWGMEELGKLIYFMPMAEELWKALPANCRL